MTKRDITLQPPAVHFLRGSGGRGDGAVVENWERAVRASGAIKALVLWDAWQAGYSPAQLTKMLPDIGVRSTTCRLIAFGCLCSEMMAEGVPMDTLPKERAVREYLVDAKAHYPDVDINDRPGMAEVAKHARRAYEAGSLPASTLPETGELLNDPEEHPRDKAAKAIKAGSGGVQAIRRFSKRLESTLALHGTLSGYMQHLSAEDQDAAKYWIRKTYRQLSDLADEVAHF